VSDVAQAPRPPAPAKSGHLVDIERRAEVLGLLEQVGRLTAWLDATVRIVALADDTGQVERLAVEVEVVTERRRRLLRQVEAAIELRYLADDAAGIDA